MSSKAHLDRILGTTTAAAIGIAPAREQGVTRSSLLSIALDRLMPDPANPRTDLTGEQIQRMAESLAELGQQQPIRVRWSDQHRLWIVIAGHCRLAGAKLAGLPALQAVVEDRVLSPEQLLTAQLTENLARHDMSDLDTARALRQLIDATGVTQQQLARQMGRSAAWVCRMLQLLDLPTEQQTLVATGAMPKRSARAATRRRGRSRRGPLQLRLTAPGIVVLITRTRATADLPAIECLERVRQAAEQIDVEQRRDAA